MFCIEIDPQFCGNTFWCQNMYLGVKYLPTTGYLGAGISVVTLQSFKGMHLVTKSTNKETNYLPNKQKKKNKKNYVHNRKHAFNANMNESSMVSNLIHYTVKIKLTKQQ